MLLRRVMSLLQALDLAGAKFGKCYGNFRAACNAPWRLRTHPLQEVSPTLAQTDTLVSTNWFRCRDSRCSAALGPLDILTVASRAGLGWGPCEDPDDDFVERVCPLCGTARGEVDTMQLARAHGSLLQARGRRLRQP